MWDGAYALGRALTTVVFIVAGVPKFMDVTGILNAAGTKAFWALVGGGAPPTWLGYLIAAVEVIGGLMVLVGYKTRAAALVLAAFTVATILFAHNWWTMEGAARAANLVQANKNLAIIGAFLMIAAVGAGRYSVDNRNSST
jgi:putative oxidoreductase